MKKILIVLAVGISCLGTIVQAQNTSNPYTVNTTNSVVLAPIANGFGVAVLGYPMPTPGTNFFSDNLDGVALSDTTVVDVNTLQFYAADEDNQTVAGKPAYNIVGYHVLQSASNPNSLTVAKSFAASIQTNAPVGPDSGYGSGCVGTIGLGGVSKNGTIAVRVDGTSAPGSPGLAGEGVLTLSAQVPTTTIITNAVEPLANGGKTVAIGSNTGDIPQIGQNGLVVKNTFNGLTYVARSDIFSNSLAGDVSAAPPSPANGTNNQMIVNGSIAGVTGVYNFGTWNTRGSMGFNETAHMLAGYVKTAADNTTGGDSMTGLAVIKYTDAGGPISPTSLQTNVFGSTAPGNFPAGGITTNGQYFFSRTAFNGPEQISINDSGAVAFAVSFDINAANDATNGTRAAQITGIILQPAGSSSFLKVCDNTDPTLFLQIPEACTNKNLISDVAIDNLNNVYFEAAYTNNPAFGIITNACSTTTNGVIITTNSCTTVGSCDLFPSNAVYEAVSNDPTNPTSWAVRILLRQGDSFTDPVSGNVFKVIALPYNAGPLTRTVSQRSFGPNAINRSMLPGHSVANTAPSSAFAVGGILVQASLTNLTQNIRTDGLLYIAPYTSAVVCPPLPFVVTAVSRSGNNFNITYNAQTGTNIVQALPGGNYTSSGFVDLPASTNIVTGCPVSANFTDVGGVTSSNGYFRVRLIQP